MNGPTAIIIGHSFVKRYGHWIGSRNPLAPKHLMEICDRYSDIQLLGYSGMTSDQIHHNDTLFQAAKHDIVIVDCGTNDLANCVPISKIVNNLLLFARRCIQEGAKIVFIMSTIPRSKHIQCNSEEFRQRANQLNDELKKICVMENNISFYRQTGFSHAQIERTSQPVACWSDDGIHPSPRRRHHQQKSGMEKYHQSIKTALHRALHRHIYLTSGQYSI